MNIIHLLSGGIDSTAIFLYLKEKYPEANIYNLFFKFSQKNQKEELLACQRISETFNTPLISLDISNLFSINSEYSTETGTRKVLSYQDSLNFFNKNQSKKIALEDYVPNRNGTFINIAATIGLQLYNNEPFFITTGLYSSKESATAHPDGDYIFLEKTKSALEKATNGIASILYFPNISSKKDLLEQEISLEYLEQTVSCNNIKNQQECGNCKKCFEKIQAFYPNIFSIKDCLKHFRQPAFLLLRILKNNFLENKNPKG